MHGFRQIKIVHSVEKNQIPRYILSANRQIEHQKCFLGIGVRHQLFFIQREIYRARLCSYLDVLHFIHERFSGKIQQSCADLPGHWLQLV